MYKNRVKRFTGQAQKKAKKVATIQTVRKMIQSSVETKRFDYEDAPITPGNTWSIRCISNVLQGDTAINRTGNEISPSKIVIRLQAHAHASAVGDVVRVLVFQDRMSDGAVPTQQMIGFQDNAYGQIQHFKSALDAQSRYNLLRDKMITFDTSQVDAYRTIVIYLKGKMTFGLLNNDYQKNAIHVAVWSLDNTNKNTITYYARLNFKDA